MSDHLLDQIASRFGRQSLILEDTPLYKKHHTQAKRRGEFFQSMYANTDLTSFADALNTYVSQQMGQGDIYVCPICYAEAIRRFDQRTKGGDSDDDSEDNSDDGDGNEEDGDDGDGGGTANEKNNNTITTTTTARSVETHTTETLWSSSKTDPMTILGDLDCDEFIVASMFCFRKLVQVKAHIRNVHNLDTKMVEGNDLYKNFMIRAQDGLLQRYLHTFWKDKIFPGAMQKYWFEGNNANFVLLRMLVDKVEYMR
eukprot:CAMPEP_0198258800 /NCGR_PEP_ID=MMETSP1447-20131203/8135_1 /TAXON_ID=420782 /ORGANISM="Chaetoceros dichaeta, Strain CCMP1751" /LENGTH=254 /DNA_ID=CAMNT_0043946017 /DNA_START=68 /DNA_END=828 /DNA_ORIENTATION=+